MDDSKILGILAILVSVGTAIIGAINHKRLRSSCCGKKTEVSIDIENTTPPTPRLAEPPATVPKIVVS